MKKIFLILYYLTLLQCFILIPSFASADFNSDIERIVNSIQQTEQEIAEKQASLSSPNGAGKEQELQKQILELSNNQKSLEQSLEEITAGVNVDAFIYTKAASQKISWQAELEELVAPILSQVKRATSRPREIEKLRTDLSDTNDLIHVTETALHNLSVLKANFREKPQVEQKLSLIQQSWEQRKKSLLAKASIVRQKLEQRVGEKKNLSQSLEEIFHLFFKSRGRNLLFALLAGFGFWVFSKKVSTLIKRPKRKSERTFNTRLFNMLFLLGSGIGAIFVYLLVLFFTGDWLLLILSFFIITGIIWNSKDAISKFWGEALLLLNLGPVREGERVLYNGVPMRVGALNYNASLDNPCLDGNAIKIPLNDLLGMRSRTNAKDENWFPTNSGDWILLDNHLAQVEVQTIENTTVRFPGGAYKIIRTAEFLEMDKLNLSSGFRISVSLGLDYDLSKIVTSEVIKIVELGIKSELEKSAYAKAIKALRVEFEKPSSSSIDVVIITDFAGEVAKDYDVLKRYINRIALDICNKNDWQIPFQQLDINLKSGNLS